MRLTSRDATNNTSPTSPLDKHSSVNLAKRLKRADYGIPTIHQLPDTGTVGPRNGDRRPLNSIIPPPKREEPHI